MGLALTAIFVAAGLAGCHGAKTISTTPDQIPPDRPPAPVPVVIGVASRPTDPFSLTAAAVVGDILEIEVQHAGGCRDHTFMLTASDSFQDTAPPRLVIMLIHDADEDPCEAWLIRQLRFGLAPIKELYRTATQQDSGTVHLILAQAPSPLVYQF